IGALVLLGQTVFLRFGKISLVVAALACLFTLYILVERRKMPEMVIFCAAGSLLICIGALAYPGLEGLAFAGLVFLVVCSGLWMRWSVVTCLRAISLMAALAVVAENQAAGHWGWVI